MLAGKLFLLSKIVCVSKYLCLQVGFTKLGSDPPSCSFWPACVYFDWQSDDDEEAEEMDAEEGQPRYVAHVPVPSQKEVRLIIVIVASYIALKSITQWRSLRSNIITPVIGPFI